MSNFKKIAKIINNHSKGIETKISKRIISDIEKTATASGFNGPFKILRIANFAEFDFFQPSKSDQFWTAIYNANGTRYIAEVKKTQSGTAIWKVLDDQNRQLGWGSFMPDNSYNPNRRKDEFRKRYPSEVEQCFQAANAKLDELLTQLA